MANNLELAVRIRADLKSALRGLDQMEKGVDDVGRSMKRASLGAETFGTAVRSLVTGDLVARGLVTLGRAMQRFAADSVRAAVDAQSIADSMRAVTGGATAAAAELAFVAGEARRLGLDLPSAERAFIALTAAARGTTLQGQAARDIFSSIAEAGRALGLSAADQAGALTAIEQIISKGTVSAEELRGQLGERLPGAFQIAARAMGVTTAALGEMLQRGEVVAEDFLPKFAQALRRAFGAGAADAAAGPAAAFQRLDNAILSLQRTVVQSGGVLDFLADVADGLADIASGVDAAFGDGPLSPGTVTRLRAAYREVSAELVQVREELAKSAAAAPGVDLDATDLGRRRAALRAQLRALAAELGDRVPRIPGLDIDSGPDPESSKEAQRYLERLRGQVEALRDLSHEEQVLEAIRSGALQGAREADQQAALRLAGELDAAKAQEEAGQRRRAAVESDRALASLRRQEIDEEAAALEELAARHRDLRGELAGLAGPYAVAVHAAEEWRREQHAALAALTAQGHATEALGDIVEEVYDKKIAAAVREASGADAELARQRLRNATDLKSGIDRALQDLGAELNDFAALSERAVTGAVRGMEDAFVRFVSTGKLSFKSLADSIIADLARIAIRQQITLPLLGSLTNLANALGGTPIEGTVQHAGGVAGAPGGVRRVVPRAAFAGAPRLHRGGLASDEIPTILRRGEGVFTAEQMRALGPTMPTEIRIEFINQGTAQQQAGPARISSEDGQRLVARIVTEDVASNGPIAQTMQRRFGLSGRVS